MMKQVMKRAWEIAKTGVTKFGGKVREYFAASLSIAWKEIKTMSNVVTSFAKLDGKVQVEVTANPIGGLLLAINGEGFRAETIEQSGQWAYIVRSAKATKLMEALSGRKLPANIVAFADASAEHALVKAEQINFNQLDKNAVLNAVCHYGRKTTFNKFENVEALKEVNELMAKNEKLAEVFEAIGGEIEHFTGGCYLSIKKSQLPSLVKALKQADAERIAKAEAENAEVDAKRAALIEKARETGKPQVLYTYTVDCPDANEDCSFDSVTVTIDAEGNIKKTQSHCW